MTAARDLPPYGWTAGASGRTEMTRVFPKQASSGVLLLSIAARRVSAARSRHKPEATPSLGAVPLDPRAVSSGGEHFLDAEGVRGSNPLPPTTNEQVTGAARTRVRAP